ncbi:MAG TPA: hypothetical protein DEV85_03495 [Vibrio sp.]|uniref:NADH dehydrogenase subunit II-related protein n=1 Tax=Vibrio algivorus TaxID=1667024 RepID=A0ABQ6EJW8_9VIBR|nr:MULTISPECIES: hypothetical protein [Vibrio]GLT13284.1 hypothetical protein GCM10007931_02580 [Vibrio algivorus]HCH00941.1 hypothetical protein [Vibrio sp.]
MLTRYAGMTPKSQSYLFTFGLALTLIGMMVTDMWLPMVAGAIILAGLAVESWIRILYIIPMKKQLTELTVRLTRLEHK